MTPNRQTKDALRRGNTERAVTEPDRAAGQLQRQGGGEGAPGEVPHCQIRIASDVPDQEAVGRRDVAVRRAAEALRSPGKLLRLSLYIYTINLRFVG